MLLYMCGLKRTLKSSLNNYAEWESREALFVTMEVWMQVQDLEPKER